LNPRFLNTSSTMSGTDLSWKIFEFFVRVRNQSQGTITERYSV